MKKKKEIATKERFWWYLSPDMLVYMIFPAIQIWKSIIMVKQEKEMGGSILISFICDATLVLLSCGLISTIYRRNKDTHRSRSRSGIIIALFCISLLIISIKDCILCLVLK